MSDAWLIIGIFVFAFVLWVSTGGPDRPISFAGPYITPITDVGDIQSGYGEHLNLPNRIGGDGERVWSVKSVLGRFENAVEDGETVGPVSPSAGRVEIVGGSGGPRASDPRQEYVTLRAKVETDITGWSLRSSRSGAEAVIPQEASAPSGPLTNVILGEDDEAIITTGVSVIGSGFRENKCIGYVGGTAFTPSLSTRSCPAPVDELGDFYTGTADSFDACRNIVRRMKRCEPAQAPGDSSGECAAFISANLNYQGCVTNHFNDKDFRGDTWRVFLNRGSELWRSTNDTILLIDREGRTVDVYSY